MAKRQSLSKKTRFEIFKRDQFTCRYCGQTPSTTILHVDHIHPVAEGGTDEPENLVTACADCNLGKGARLLGKTLLPIDAERVEDISEQAEQLSAYTKAMKEQREAREERRRFLMECVSEELLEGFFGNLSKNQEKSIEKFVAGLGLEQVEENARIATGRINDQPFDGRWKYFCAVCWRQMRELEDVECPA